jgi:TPR repeat protein
LTTTLAKAAELGVLDALMEITILYRDGNPKMGVDKNKKKYVYWLKKEAEIGIPMSMRNLSRMYRKGDGVSRDIEKAFGLLEQRVKEDDLTALKMMGEYYEKGLVVDQDFVTAYMMYDLSGATPNKPREKLAPKMTEAQIREAIGRSWQWQVERESYRPTSKGYSYRYPLEEVD